MKIFNRRSTKRHEEKTGGDQNPWAGLASYEDPEKAERKLKFCGRDEESYDVAKLIMNNIFVTLYGKSGVGKTSLLNAGVSPELREENYLPISLRLGMRDEKTPQSFQTMIVEAIKRTSCKMEVLNVIEEQKNQQSVDFLWNYFARHRFFNQNDDSIAPVFFFDQFEEVFRGNRQEAEVLLRQLDYINDKDHTLDNCIVGGKSYRYVTNFRFVVSIREDDLYRLEDSIDNCYLPALKRCRYRLRSLSEQGAKDAIIIPGEGLFKEEDQDEIVGKIIDKSRNEDGSISTNIVSLLCSRIFLDFQGSGDDYISTALVDSFLKGNPFERFYNEATQGFRNNEKSYIEEYLVDSSGRRNSIPENDFLLHVKNGALLLDGSRKILQRTNTRSDGSNYRVELIHDSFCEPLGLLKNKREKKRRLKKILFFVVLLGTFVVLFMSTIISIQRAKITTLNHLMWQKQYSKQYDSVVKYTVALDSALNSKQKDNDSINNIHREIARFAEHNTSPLKFRMRRLNYEIYSLKMEILEYNHREGDVKNEDYHKLCSMIYRRLLSIEGIAKSMEEEVANWDRMVERQRSMLIVEEQE